MLTFNVIATICVIYVLALFSVAALAERTAATGRMGFLQSPLVYTLSISVYCTAWTFYGSVGSATRNGFEFLTIYLGPTLVFLGWWWFLRKLVRIGRTERITSIADLISSRYGRSNWLAVIVTLLAVVGSTPYIALQLQSLTLSFAVFTEGSSGTPSKSTTALFIAIGLAIFTIVFGTRNLDANERHHGVVTAIAIEAIVKLIALIAIGIFVVWGVNGGTEETVALMQERLPKTEGLFAPRWVTLTFLSASAIICLPRMFQVIVVENLDERHLATASWAFPFYLFLMCLFVLPIAATGLKIMPEGANPDLFVLTLPLAENRNGLAALAFLGGFSSATSMVIVAAIALSTMLSNHIVLPLWLYFAKARNPASDDVRQLLLNARRLGIAVILALGYFYFILTGGVSALASIGLIAFLGVAQVLPALFGALFWRNGTRAGAIWGISVGFAVWAYTLFLPSFDGTFVLSTNLLTDGPFGIASLRPQSLFGVNITDPLVHATFWSLSANALVFFAVSLATNPTPLERLLAEQFISYGTRTPGARAISPDASPEGMYILAQRILGRNEAHRLFNTVAKEQGKSEGMPELDAGLVAIVERALAGSVGAATAHAMVGQTIGQQAVTFEELIAVADETAQVIEYSARLEEQSIELEETAQELRTANEKLRQLSDQKDDFLSQVSHELRTPMTSIRSFSDILKSDTNLSDDKRKQFSENINNESKRLTRLLDEILDLSFLESGQVALNLQKTKLHVVLDQAKTATQQFVDNGSAQVRISGSLQDETIKTDIDRLSQVFINLITNAIKYSDKQNPKIDIKLVKQKSTLMILVSDNGPGIPQTHRNVIFEKFARLEKGQETSGVGLGLAISKEIMGNLGGDLECLENDNGAVFRVTLPSF